MKKEAWEFFKLNFKWLVVGIIFLLLWTKGVFNTRNWKGIIENSTTTYVYHTDSSKAYQPQPVNVLPANPVVIQQPQYQPDTSSIAALRDQFNKLVQRHTERNVYSDTLKVDSIGWVNVRDTVSENKLSSRSFNYKIKERVITNTVTAKPRNQVYGGFSLENYRDGPGVFRPTTLSVDISLINKHYTMFNISGLYDFNSGNPGVSIGMSKLISFRK